ncbi:MAG: HU family DNA-binding protein, partial [Planctomycetota bacterium]
RVGKFPVREEEPGCDGDFLFPRRIVPGRSVRLQAGCDEDRTRRKGVIMNKADLVAVVQGNLGESKAGAERAVNAVVDAIKTGVKKDNSVQVVGFGTFSVRHRAARKGRNPQTGETIQIKASKSVAFKPSKNFKEMI